MPPRKPVEATEEAAPVEVEAPKAAPPQAPKQPKMSELLGALSSMSDEEKATMRELLGVGGSSEPSPAAPEPPSLVQTSGIMPVWKEETAKLRVAKVAEAFKLPEDKVMAYAVRASLDADGDPIASTAVLRCLTVNGEKHAIPYTK